ncbi:hypothetical protein [Herbiconiux sp. YIM B11900]|uniref:hypothetical protein n=1 Tax=Herbiconiux sp. YIM B11900 TaxID=3404131 RepID=UPI003F847F8B
MSWIEQFGGALLTALGLGLLAVIGLLLYRFLSLVASSRRSASKARASNVAEDKLMARLQADGFSPKDAEAALRATRDGAGREARRSRAPDDTQP